MNLFNLFTRTDSDSKPDENTLGKEYKSAQKKLDDFIKLAKKNTSDRRHTFDSLIKFVIDGEQWTNAEVKDLDGAMDLTFNFSEDYVDRYIARLFPRNPHTGVLEIGVKVYDKEQEKLEKAIMNFYDKNKIVSVVLEQATNYLVGGSGVFYFPQDPIDGKAKLISLDPRYCYFGWKGCELVQFAYKDYVGDNNWDIFYWDLHEFLHFDSAKNSYYSKLNPYNFIPVAWMPNKPKPHTHEGRSKLLSLYNLDRAYNFAATDYSRRVDDNTEPHLAVFSDNVSLENVGRGKKKKTKLGTNDDMKYLELQEGKEILDYLALLEAKIKTKAGIVDSAGSVKSGISGVSLSYQYSDMMDLIGFMRVIWDDGFRKMNKAILTYEYGEKDYRTDPVYHPFISLDNKQRVEEYVLMIQNKLISHRDAIDELRGVENAEEKVAEILAEAEKFAPPEPDGDDDDNKKSDDDKKN